MTGKHIHRLVATGLGVIRSADSRPSMLFRLCAVGSGRPSCSGGGLKLREDTSTHQHAVRTEQLSRVLPAKAWHWPVQTHPSSTGKRGGPASRLIDFHIRLTPREVDDGTKWRPQARQALML